MRFRLQTTTTLLGLIILLYDLSSAYSTRHTVFMKPLVHSWAQLLMVITHIFKQIAFGAKPLLPLYLFGNWLGCPYMYISPPPPPSTFSVDMIQYICLEFQPTFVCIFEGLSSSTKCCLFFDSAWILHVKPVIILYLLQYCWYLCTGTFFQ